MTYILSYKYGKVWALQYYELCTTKSVINLPFTGTCISIGSLSYSIPSTVYEQTIISLCCTVILIVCPLSVPAKHPEEHFHLNSLLATGVDMIEHVKSRTDPTKYVKLLFSAANIPGVSFTIETFTVKRN